MGWEAADAAEMERAEGEREETQRGLKGVPSTAPPLQPTVVCREQRLRSGKVAAAWREHSARKEMECNGMHWHDGSHLVSFSELGCV